MKYIFIYDGNIGYDFADADVQYYNIHVTENMKSQREDAQDVSRDKKI